MQAFRREPKRSLRIGFIPTALPSYLARALRARDKDSRLILISQDSGHDYAKPMLSTAFARSGTLSIKVPSRSSNNSSG